MIQSSFDDAWAYDETEVFDVRIRGGGAVKRVALLRPGSVTHAFDMAQRYVELLISEPPTLKPGTNDVYTVEVQTPPDGFHAPPGWYMLTVVSDDDLPSKAKWVMIQ